jgi:peptidoglycan/LPS O-acetylase OafA/YrhL
MRTLTAVKRSEPLDGLRGIAVLMVLLSHASNGGHDVLPGLDAGGIGRGGVFLFFILSSFLLTSQVLDRAGSGEGVGWGRFAVRRLMRVVPAFAVCLGVYVALGEFSPTVALQHLIFLRGEAHFWTVPVEVLFYLSLPALGLVLSALRGRLARALVLVAGIAGLSWVFPPDYPARAPDFTPNVLPFMPVFLAGSLLAVLGPRLSSLRGKGGQALAWAGAVGAVGMLLLTPSVASSVLGEPVPHRRFHLWFLEQAALWSLLLMGCIVPSGALLRTCLSWRPLTALGWISYSVYLYHAVALALVAAYLPAGHRGWIGPLGVGLSVLLGGLSYALVERPSLRLSQGGGARLPLPNTSPPD